ncbi:hypothetical protein PTSG_08492 [Salpingoeca rosetta]|uniref:Ras-GEF domain-containing protein n=1 Tax=Salpingoeca rosetta (strain ATCC 50818 / BSB-021) TaxID=946362 RepID=F2UJU8_SALR5|nr:uncharacterized protein PTSG_08492 [Salpingoeca rosetta]EGD77397.1 hypothetical protein PTSG_08492 [Salpingoeca rosetta]|eukprot:XP_004990741.1 hypothetical protein PTSG_08492 [Salpingoeca rosetta]
MMDEDMMGDGGDGTLAGQERLTMAQLATFELEEEEHSALELVQLARVLDSQGHVDEAEDLFQAAFERLQQISEQSADRRDALVPTLNEVESRLNDIHNIRFADLSAQAAELLVAGEEAQALENYEEAKECFVEAVDIFFELEARAQNREERTQMSMKAMEVCNKIEEVRVYCAPDTDETQPGEHLSVSDFEPRSNSVPSEPDQRHRLSSFNSAPGASLNRAQAGRRSRVSTISRELNDALSSTRHQPDKLVETQLQDLNEEDKQAERSLSDAAGAEFSFRDSTSLVIEDSDALHQLSTPVRRSLLGLFAQRLACLHASCPLELVSIQSMELEINQALQLGLGVSLGKLAKLQELSLVHTGITAKGAELLADGLKHSKSILTLNLDFNSLGDEGVDALCTHLLTKDQKSLRQLSLKSNGLSEVGAFSLCHALDVCTTLYNLDLQGNMIGCEAVDVFTSRKAAQVVYIGLKHESRSRGCHKDHRSSRRVLLQPFDPKTYLDVARHDHAHHKKSKKSILRRRTRSPSREERTPRTPSKPKRSSFDFVIGHTHSAPRSPHTLPKVTEDDTNVLSYFDDAVTTEQMYDHYVSVFDRVDEQVTAPNILLVGQRGVGKTSLINAIFDSNVTGKQQQMAEPGRPLEYRDVKNRFKVWDTTSLESDHGNHQDCAAVEALLRRQSVDKDPNKHVHALWYIVSAPVWQLLDDIYLAHLCHVVAFYGIPVVVIINKADTIPRQRLAKLKEDILASAAGSKIAGVFTVISDLEALQSHITQQLKSAGCPDVVLPMKVQKKIQEELDFKHNIQDAIAHAISSRRPAARHAVMAIQLMSLQRKESTACDVMRAHLQSYNRSIQQSLFKQMRRGKKRLSQFIGKLALRQLGQWGFVTEQRGDDEADVSAAFGQTILDSLGEHFQALTSHGSQVDASLFVAIGVLWTVTLKLHRQHYLRLAADDQPLDRPVMSAVAAAIEDFKANAVHLEGTQKVTEELLINQERTEHTSAQPPAIATHKILREIETLVSDGDPMWKSARPSTADCTKTISTVCDETVQMIMQPSSPPSVRDAFFASYAACNKFDATEIVESMERLFMAHTYSDNGHSRHICSIVASSMVQWFETLFDVDFVLPDSSDGEALELESDYIALLTLQQEGVRLAPVTAHVCEFIEKIEKTPCGQHASHIRQALEASANKMVHALRLPQAAALPDMDYDFGLMFDESAIATHICYRNACFFRKFKIRDFFDAQSACRTQMIHFANQVTYWVVENIVSRSNTAQRAHLLGKFIRTAHHLMSEPLLDFQGFMAVMTALQLSHVSRLKRTWKRLTKDQPYVVTLFEKTLTPLADPGNGMYNTILARITALPAGSSAVPFLGSFMTAIERSKTCAKRKTGADNLEQAKIFVETTKSIDRTVSCLNALKRERDWEDFFLLPQFVKFVEESLPTRFDLSSNKARNQVEEELNALSLESEPRVPHVDVTDNDANTSSDKPATTRDSNEGDEGGKTDDTDSVDGLDMHGLTPIRRSSRPAFVARLSLEKPPPTPTTAAATGFATTCTTFTSPTRNGEGSEDGAIGVLGLSSSNDNSDNSDTDADSTTANAPFNATPDFFNTSASSNSSAGAGKRSDAPSTLAATTTTAPTASSSLANRRSAPPLKINGLSPGVNKLPRISPPHSPQQSSKARPKPSQFLRQQPPSAGVPRQRSRNREVGPSQESDV